MRKMRISGNYADPHRHNLSDALSKTESCAAKVEMFDFSDARIEGQGLRI